MSGSPPSLAQILRATPHRDRRQIRPPAREFTILFLARTGSSHLAELLTSAGIGDVREWLNPAFVEGQAKYFGTTNFGDYFAAIRSACPNGVFGQKMTIWFYEQFSREVRLEEHFDFGAPCVFLFREDIVQQAVSLCFAAKRNVFHDTGSAPRLAEIAYDAADIRQCIDGFTGEELRMRAFVERHRSNVRYLSYEQLAAREPGDIVSAIAELVDAKADVVKMKSAHRKLGDDANRAHARRFAEEHPMYVANVAAQRQWLFDALRSRPLV